VLRQIITLRQSLPDLKPVWASQMNLTEQTPTPGSSVYYSNLNWMSHSELEFLCFFGILSNEIHRNDILRLELILNLPKKVQKDTNFSELQKAILLRLLQDRLQRKLPLYENRQRALLKLFSPRRIKGLLRDPVIRKSVLQRLKPRVVKPKQINRLPGGTPIQYSRHRGYRDHGAARPSHKWKPTSDWSLTRQQWSQEQLKELDCEFYKVFLHNPFKLCFST
jgi:hypothetical protein